jgi:hypothetical protein
MISQSGPFDLTAVEHLGHFVCMTQLCANGRFDQAKIAASRTPMPELTAELIADRQPPLPISVLICSLVITPWPSQT